MVTAGTTTDDPDSRQPLLTVLGPQARPQDVDISQDPRRHRSRTRRQRHRGGQRHAGRGGQRQRLSRGLDLGERRQLLDPGQRPDPGRAGPARGPAADQRDLRRRRLAGGGRRHRRRRPASRGPRLGQRQRLDRRRPRGRLQPARPVHRAGGRGTGRLRHRRLSGRRGPHHRRGLVVGGPDRVAARGHAVAAPGAGPAGRPGSGQMLGVTAGPRGFVAVGADGDAPAAWTSTDGGRAWTQQNVPLPVGATRAVLQRVASSGRTVVAVGTALTTAGQQLPFAASSADGGATWTESALPVPAGRAFITALTALTGTGTGTEAGAGPARSWPPGRSAAPPATRTWWCGPRPADHPGRRSRRAARA